MAITQNNIEALLTSSQGAVRASGTVTFSTDVPTDGDFVTLNGRKWTFKDTASDTYDIQIAGTFQLTAAAAKAAWSASKEAKTSLAEYTVSGGVVTVTYITTGTAGNSFSLVKSGTNIAVSAAALSGGTSTGGGTFDPDSVTGGTVAAARLNSDFENTVISLVAVAEYVINSSEDPTADVTKARQQRKVLRDVLQRMAQLVPTTADETADDRAAVSARLKTAAVSFYNNAPRPDAL